MGKIQRARITVLDLGLAGSTGKLLRDVLTECSDQNGQWRFEVSLIEHPPADDAHIDNILADHVADAVFLILPQALQFRSPSLLRLLKVKLASSPVIVVSETQKPDEMFDLLRQGADEFIPLPIESVNVLPRLWRLLKYSSDEMISEHELRNKFGLRQMIGQSPAWIEQIKKIPLIARSDANVLITGETGTGKELCARAIHYASLRASMPFVPVNCGAIPENLIENELFGHTKGAFTDAGTTQVGLLGEADGGTLFLDEIDCVTPAAQVKLLRFLQEKEYRPLGSSKTLQADVRIVAATNVNLDDALRSGKFRRDLYYRINVVPVSLPSLRERPEDILLLARHFLKKHAIRLARPAKDFSAAALRLLEAYGWPGNVRELEHIVERAVVFCDSERIDATHLSLHTVSSPRGPESFQRAKARTIADFEKSYIEKLLIDCDGNISKAARAAQKNRRAFWELMRKHQIQVV